MAITKGRAKVALRYLTHWNDPIFRKKSRMVEKFDESLWTLLDDMRETLANAGGYGCAAVHVRILRRAVIVNDENGVIELINPVIAEESSETQQAMEGSIAPGSPQATVIRPQSVAVSAFDRHGNPIAVSGTGFLAATFCHEIDHLDGILFTDKQRRQIDGQTALRR
jgi:peptide deformylase